MDTIFGNLITLAQEGKFDVIIHGCNCFCTMGAGFATQIRNSFPEAYDADLKTPKGGKSKLGTCSFGVSDTNGKRIIVVNAYTQFKHGGKGVLVDYKALQSCLKWVKEKYSGKRIGMPKTVQDWQEIIGKKLKK